MSDFLYLVQGQASLVGEYLYLADRPNADAIFLTYDQPLDGAIYFPNSTWAQGRNRLLELALEAKPALYYIFCDDDVLFTLGGWQDFEDLLARHKPAIGVPIVPRTRRTPGKTLALPYQPVYINDEQIIAFHREAVDDRLVLPYCVKFDDLHWWASCEIQQILIQNFYFSSTLQFNSVHVDNLCARRYANCDEARAKYPAVVRQWLQGQFKNGFRDTLRSGKRKRPILAYHAARYLMKRLSGVLTQAVRPERVEALLHPDSVFMARYVQSRGVKTEVALDC